MFKVGFSADFCLNKKAIVVQSEVQSRLKNLYKLTNNKKKRKKGKEVEEKKVEKANQI